MPGADGVPDALAEEFWDVVRENCATRADVAAWWGLCQSGTTPLVDADDKEFVQSALALLPDAPFTANSWPEWTAAVKDASGRKGRQLFMPLRKALTGQAHGPDMSRLMPLLQNVPRSI